MCEGIGRGKEQHLCSCLNGNGSQRTRIGIAVRRFGGQAAGGAGTVCLLMWRSGNCWYTIWGIYELPQRLRMGRARAGSSSVPPVPSVASKVGRLGVLVFSIHDTPGGSALRGLSPAASRLRLEQPGATQSQDIVHCCCVALLTRKTREDCHCDTLHQVALRAAHGSSTLPVILGRPGRLGFGNVWNITNKSDVTGINGNVPLT